MANRLPSALNVRRSRTVMLIGSRLLSSARRICAQSTRSRGQSRQKGAIRSMSAAAAAVVSLARRRGTHGRSPHGRDHRAAGGVGRSGVRRGRLLHRVGGGVRRPLGGPGADPPRRRGAGRGGGVRGAARPDAPGSHGGGGGRRPRGGIRRVLAGAPVRGAAAAEVLYPKTVGRPTSPRLPLTTPYRARRA